MPPEENPPITSPTSESDEPSGKKSSNRSHPNAGESSRDVSHFPTNPLPETPFNEIVAQMNSSTRYTTDALDEPSRDTNASYRGPTNSSDEPLRDVLCQPPYQEPPFKAFQQVLSFLASIGLATTATSAFSLIGITSLFGDTSPPALSQIRQSALFLCWASACFIAALAFIIALQLLYTELVIVEIMTNKDVPGWNARFIRIAVGLFAWIPLGFQMVAMYLMSQALEVFAPGPVQLARYGLTCGVAVVGVITLFGMLSNEKGRQKLSGFVPCRIYGSSNEQ
ncbi:hypothetical protein B0H13DRAFT_1903408 [Mycena leptocephala]|nr:hypothetical protein B0H13DRAFT_1903408 [Mycena leptocephala]